MTRIPVLNRLKFDEHQAALWELFNDGRPDADRLDGGGELLGPSNALMRIPELATTMVAFNRHLRTGTLLDQRLVELAICIVASHSRADFAFWRHGPSAVSRGIDQRIIDELRDGLRPSFNVDDERIVHDLATQILSTSEVDDQTYDAAITCLGERGVVELIATVGFYFMIGMILNVFEVAIPDQETIFGRRQPGRDGAVTRPQQPLATGSNQEVTITNQEVTMNHVGLWAHIPVHPGTRAAAAKAAEFALEKVNEEDGAVLFLVTASDNDPDALLVLELYRDDVALQAHQEADWLPEYMESMKEFIAGEPSFHVVRPLLAKGL